jgi:hypothetical protein
VRTNAATAPERLVSGQARDDLAGAEVDDQRVSQFRATVLIGEGDRHVGDGAAEGDRVQQLVQVVDSGPFGIPAGQPVLRSRAGRGAVPPRPGSGACPLLA